MTGSYNPYLVVFSIVAAILASHMALDISRRISTIRSAGRPCLVWLAGGAVAVGIGIWSMQFIGMLAFSLPIRLGYDPIITACSLLIAMAVSYFALYIVTRDELSLAWIFAGGLLIGGGLAGMHFTGTAAMRMHPAISYDSLLASVSIAAAVLASWAALWIVFALRQPRQKHFQLKRIVAALAIGLAISRMHSMAMAAAIFSKGSVSVAAQGISSIALALTVTASALIVLVVGVVSFILEMRFSLAMLDSLTGLPNRLSFARSLERMIRSCRRSGKSFAILFMDVDGFKTINDSLGHTAGDKVLKSFAQRLRATLRRSDMLARLGGDEFVMLLPGLDHPEAASIASASVISRIPRSLTVDGSSQRVTVSVGIAIYPQDGTSTEGLLKCADTAMYDAKQRGRDTFSFFDPGMSEAAERVMSIERGLADALANNQLSLNFQPQFETSTQDLVGVEALLRWTHPWLGKISPVEFIPIAERSGQILEISDWLIREVCTHIRQWDSAGLPEMRVAINLSPRQLHLPEIVENIYAAVTEGGVTPDRIVCEITETVAMQSVEQTAKTIAKFHSLGFDVAIDDFGTGYSSLAYLQQFRPKFLKMDRCFVSQLDDAGNDGVAIVSAIIAMAHSLDMRVIGEGVETESQLEQLKLLSCDQVQGYLLSTPLPPVELERFLQKYIGEFGQNATLKELSS